jgi:hypothetical protein
MVTTIGPERHHGTLSFEEHKAAAEAEGAVVCHPIHLSRFYGGNTTGAAGDVNQHGVGSLPLLPLLRFLNVVIGRMGAGIAGDRGHALSRGQKVELIHCLEGLDRDEAGKFRGGHLDWL